MAESQTHVGTEELRRRLDWILEDYDSDKL